MGKKGQAVIEYVLLVVMISVTVAVIIRNTTSKIYGLWTGLTSVIASGCVDCPPPVRPPPLP